MGDDSHLGAYNGRRRVEQLAVHSQLSTAGMLDSGLEPQERAPEDASDSRGDTDDSMKRKAEREPESPGQDDLAAAFAPMQKKERLYYDEFDHDSPSSYPKHVMVPRSEPFADKPMTQPFSGEKPHHGTPVLTPDSLGRRPMPTESYDGSHYPHQQQYHDVYRAPSYQDMEYGRHSYGSQPPPQGGGDYGRPRRWACDFCNVATFLSFEEACAHEETCSHRHRTQDPHFGSHSSNTGSYGAPPGQPMPQQGTGLGVLYHASQEVVTPPTPHQYQQSQWGTRGPPLPVLPHEQGYFRQGYYDHREDLAYNRGPADPYYGHPGARMYHGAQNYQKRMLLALPADSDSLSDRQCYVRAEMVEIFAAAEKDVSARHSKGAQKLSVGQVGIRCIHCSHLRARDRAERAVCYPSSIARIYQTVADMQRFHFEQCSQIPEHVRQIYKKLKTTRPRGVGSPQTYWIQSAKSLGLADTTNGIRFDTDLAKEAHQPVEMDAIGEIGVVDAL